MHKKNTQRWSKLISTAGILAVLFGGLFAQSVRAVISNPTPVCVGSSCSITFESSGDYYAWAPPAGARNLSFDLMGGQGGRSGGQGGRLTGALNTFSGTLYIFVGGAGLQGAGSAGGFNGGGAAGSGRGDEGSGGGATDIRSTTAIGDRIAVAAGGGGSGGFSGGTGGSGGGITGSNGTSGQGQGGMGATQSNGGNGGYPNGGTWGTNGASGLGGAGGSSSVSGGGGGGGGYFGGGGGGADIDTCCSNAGGGGGGSSWANTALTTSVAHVAGYRAGAGLAIMNYTIPPSVTSLTATSSLTNATSINYNLSFSESVSGLTNTDFVMTGSSTNCSGIAVTGASSSYLVTVSGCGVGTLKLTLLADSVTGLLTGPPQDKAALDVVIERTVPGVNITGPAATTSLSNLDFSLVFTEPVTGLTSSDFTVTGTSCVVGAVTGSQASYAVQITNCADSAIVQLALMSNSVIDIAGNLGPANVPVIAPVKIDRTAPVGVWSTPQPSTYTDPTFEINFGEEVTGFTASDISITGTATGCQTGVTLISVGRFSVSTSGCSIGSIQLNVSVNSYTDAFGNVGPSSILSTSVTSKIAIPAPTPSPTATPIPIPIPSQVASPTPSATPTPTQSNLPAPPVSGGSGGGSSGGSGGNALVSSPIAQPVPAQTDDDWEIIAAQPVRKTYAFSSAVKVPTSPDEEAIAIYEPNASQITITNPTDERQVVAPRSDWQQYAIIGVGSLSGLLATIGVIQAARQTRNRRLVKKYA